MSARIEDLQPDVQAAARAALSELRVPFIVTATLRTRDEQVALYSQGRGRIELVNLLRKIAGLSPLDAADAGNVVTNANGVDTPSNHQGGRALDIVPLEGNRPVWPGPSDPRWMEIASVLKGHGFRWGGDWADFPDLPHYEM